MPNIGETKQAPELGFKGHATYIYVACASCGEARWTRKQDARLYCRHCGYRQYATSLLRGKGAIQASELRKHLVGNPWLYPYCCPVCGQATWKQKKDIDLHRACSPKCALTVREMPRAEKHHAWTGGRHLWKDGYIDILLQLNDLYFPMANGHNMVLEHRLVVAKALGRCLETWEIVHHKGAKYPTNSLENRQDNRYPENLELLPNQVVHLVVIQLQKEVAELRAKVKLLEWHIKDLKHGNAEPSSPKSNKVGEKV